MPAERVSMRRIREILRLKNECGASDRAVARSLGIARSTVALTLDRVAAAGLEWPLPETLSDRVLEACSTPAAGSRQGFAGRPNRTGRRCTASCAAPASRSCCSGKSIAPPSRRVRLQPLVQLYRAWEGRLSPTMRQSHPAGERLFVDYAGQTVEIVDGRTGEVREAQVFVAAMGASSYTYAEATWTQALPGLDRGPYPRARFHGRCSGPARAGQPEGRGRSGELVRAGAEPDLSRHGGALRHGDPADPGAQAARQGQGRGGRARGRALDPGPPAASPLLRWPSSTKRSPGWSPTSMRDRCVAWA